MAAFLPVPAVEKVDTCESTPKDSQSHLLHPGSAQASLTPSPFSLPSIASPAAAGTDGSPKASSTTRPPISNHSDNPIAITEATILETTQSPICAGSHVHHDTVHVMTRLRSRRGGKESVGDAFVTKIEQDPRKGTLYSIQTFVWRNQAFRLTLAELQTIFCEAVN
jgi:hypothetical protein